MSSFQFNSFCLKYSSCRSFMNGSSSVGRYSEFSTCTVADFIDGLTPRYMQSQQRAGLYTKGAPRSMKVMKGRIPGSSGADGAQLGQLHRRASLDVVEHLVQARIV